VRSGRLISMMLPATIEEVGRQWRAGAVTAADLVDGCLRRIAAENDRLRAFILVMADEARCQAEAADRELAAGRDRGPLHGMPVSIKDLLDLEGTPTTAASRVRDGHRAARDAQAVANLRQAGAVLVGKTNLHEFALGTTNEDSAFGAARHPGDPSRSPGGSSGGSAISVAAGMALASIGTDTGGSIRIPAAACGVVGLKPAYGEVSTDGVVPLARSLDHVGPLAGSVAGTYFVHRALVGDGAPRPLLAPPLKGLTLAVPRAYFCDLLDDDVRDRFERSLDRLRQAGAGIEEISIPHADAIAPVYVHILLAEAAAYHARTLENMADRYTPPVRARLESGRRVRAEDYVRALRGRDVLRSEVDAALATREALVLPTLPIPAPLLGDQEVRVGTAVEPVRSVMLRLTQLFDLTGHPAISLPCGRTATGLPCGLQLVGRRMQTEALLAIALACEGVVGFR
jgi:aspartyl-tRNA(Asn)/glutamyl-tRNA(Gln) amidotransferase subunit A